MRDDRADYDGPSGAETAELLGVTRQQVNRTERVAIRKLWQRRARELLAQRQPISPPTARRGAR